jgi:hypothetical protein
MTNQTIDLKLTETEALYLVNLLEEEGRGLPRRPSVLVSCLRKLDLALHLADLTAELKEAVDSL